MLLVVGPSGSGKSTLARAIAGLVPGDYPGELSGSIRVGDEDGPPRAGDPTVGIVFQDPASQLVMELAGDDVAFGLESRAWPLAEMRTRVPVALGEAGLAGFDRRRTNRLSGGEQQRLALAGVLAPRPWVLVLDEPTANLDPPGTAAVFAQIRGLAKAHAATIVLIEHRVEAAWRLADLVLALGADGRPIDVGPPDDVLARSREALDGAGVWLPDLPAPVARDRAQARRRGRARSGSGEPALRIEEAWFGFEAGEPTLHGVSMTVEPGERVALVGPNGSGKTTLLRLAAGLLRPRAGRVSLLGDDPARLRASELAARVGYVVQDPELGFMADTVAEESALGLDDASRAHARELAARLGLDLDRFGDRSPYLLSGGEQRRLSLVTALARRPPVLVLDEPTFGQDRHGHEALMAALDELVDGGTAVVAATHDERFVAGFADRVVTLDDGWVVSR